MQVYTAGRTMLTGWRHAMIGTTGGWARRSAPWTLGLCGLVAAWIAAASSRVQAVALPPQTEQASAVEPKAVLQRYCLTCHNQNLKQRGTVPIALDGLDLAAIGSNAEVWEKVVRKLSTGLMPPAGRPRPD